MRPATPTHGGSNYNAPVTRADVLLMMIGQRFNQHEVRISQNEQDIAELKEIHAQEARQNIRDKITSAFQNLDARLVNIESRLSALEAAP